jgi:hypothetical protein
MHVVDILDHRIEAIGLSITGPVYLRKYWVIGYRVPDKQIRDNVNHRVSHTEPANLRNYRTIECGIPDWQIRKNIGLRTQAIGLSDIALKVGCSAPGLIRLSSDPVNRMPDYCRWQ